MIISANRLIVRTGNKIKHFTTAYDILNEMMVNWDQTSGKFVPESEWTMTTKGTKQVPVFGLEDKREMTVLLITPTGKLLPPHLIYASKTGQVPSTGHVSRQMARHPFRVPLVNRGNHA